MCTSANTNPNSIQYLFRYEISNADTKNFINQAIGSEDNLRAWPGDQFLTSSTQGQALLGSAHGYGISYFLLDHQGVLGKKTVDYITAFKTQAGHYALMLHITNV